MAFGQVFASALSMKKTRAKVAALLKESRKSLKRVRRLRKKLRALRLHLRDVADKKKPVKRR
jgi:hypothetical protein